MTRRLLMGLAALLAVLILLPVNMRADDPAPLPDFQVLDLSGTTVHSADIVRHGKWLLVYVRAGGGPSTGLLKTLELDRFVDASTSTTIIVGGIPAEKLGDFAGRFPLLASATWYADPMGKVMQPLDLHGAPMTIGMSDNKMSWSLAGVLRDDQRMQSVVMTWIMK